MELQEKQAAAKVRRIATGLRNEPVLPEYDGVDMNQVLDRLMQRKGLRNDAALCRVLGVSPPIISKIRHGRVQVSPALMIRMHDVFDLSIKELRAMMTESAIAA